MHYIHPNRRNAATAQHLQADKVKNSIRYLIKECFTKLNIYHVNIESVFSLLNDHTYLTTEIHFYHHQLQTSMRNQEIDQTQLYLSKLIDSIIKKKSLQKIISIDSLSQSEWELFIKEETIRITLVECKKQAIFNELTADELTLHKDYLCTALCTLARYDPDMYDELYEQVKMIKLFKGEVTMGLTDVRILGTMLLRIPRPTINPIHYYLEHIVHEGSHIHLNCLMASDPLILNTLEKSYKSPLRSDLRPMIGIFHATYVSTRITRCLLKIYDKTNNMTLLQALAENIDESIRGIEEIKAHAQLTENGAKLLESMIELIETAHRLPEWRHYDFNHKATHRFGAGITQVNHLERLVG